MRNTDTADSGRAPARPAGQDAAPASADSGERRERRIRMLRLNSAAICVMLIAEYVLARAILARHRFAICAAAAGLAVIVGAAVSGATFVSSGRDAASMAMAMLTGAALLCYLGNLFVVRPRPPTAADDPVSGC